MRFSAPAKINLSLEVLGRRPDGFHEVRTLMVPLDLADTIEIEVDPEPAAAAGPIAGERAGSVTRLAGVEHGLPEGLTIGFACDDASLPADAGNLAVRAAAEFCRVAGWRGRITLRLAKRIPHGAGLGGGSSDAATVLSALNGLCGNPLDADALADAAAAVGSDVPFFLAGGAAWCEGRGERVRPVPGPGPLRLWLAKPPFGVPTPWAYSRWSLAAALPGIDYGPQAMGWGTLVNDLERPVFEKYLLLADWKQWLRAQPGVRGALMAGSGATVFAVLDEEADATALEAAFRAEFGDEHWATETRVRMDRAGT